MADQWYIAGNNKKMGPYPTAQMKNGWRSSATSGRNGFAGRRGEVVVSLAGLLSRIWQALKNECLRFHCPTLHGFTHKIMKGATRCQLHG
jgi:hypothetical protein